MLLVYTENKSVPLLCSRDYAIQQVRIHFTGIELSLVPLNDLQEQVFSSEQHFLFAILWIALLLPVLALCHLYGVKTGVRPLAVACCLGPLFSELVVPGTKVEKKSCQVFKAPFVRYLSMINDWHIFLPFSPFVWGHWVWEPIMKLTVTCDVFLAGVYVHTC